MRRTLVAGLLFSALLASAADNAASDKKAVYAWHVDTNVRVPMRDGVKLATDLYVPEGAGAKLPAILIRTPYDRKARTEAARMFASHGYAVAVQDVRGKFESEGTFTLSANDTNDGSDSLDWIATQPWSDGKIGTYGCSYLAEDQLELSKVRNPHHTAMIPQAGGGAYRFADLREGGAVGLAEAAPWFLRCGSKIDPAPPELKVDLQKMFLILPLVDMLKKVNAQPTDFEDFVSHEPADSWWNHFGYVSNTHHFNTPSLQVCSWYDSVVNETFELFNLMRSNGESKRARENQFVVIAPSTHCGWESANERTKVGQRDIGDARFNYDGLYLRWFDYWLKGEGNIARVPKVQIFVMGANRWRSENEWPLQRTQFTKYFLHSNGHANSRNGTGVLTTMEPNSDQELLDWLATEFVQRGWSMKAMHRLMMTSTTYRQSSKVTPEREKADPQNKLFSRMPLHRMEGEVLMDTTVMIAGRLDERRFGTPDPVMVWDDGLVEPIDGKNGWRRSIYIQQRRSETPTLLESFDFPQLNPACLERSRSNVAPQALNLLNDSMVRKLADYLATRLEREAGMDPANQIQDLYWIALSRPPNELENKTAKDGLAKLREIAFKNGAAANQADHQALAKLCHMVMNSASFLYID